MLNTLKALNMSPTHKFETVPALQPHIRTPASSSNLYIEEERLKTFRGWQSTVISPEELASNGFYYSGIRDFTRCAFCGLEVGEWVTGDVAAADHRKYSPDCDFVRGRPCGNISKGSSPSTSASATPSSSPPSYDTCGPYGFLLRPYSGPEQSTCVANLISDFEQIGVNRTEGPVQPNFATEESRLRTFKAWPETCPIRPEQLAEAGFYFEGKSDHALCFYCGGGLKDWEEGDDPWIEHARWFSQCAFVTMHKGRDFVARACQSGPAVLPASTVNELLNDKSEKPEPEESQDVVGGVVARPATEPEIPADKSELEICKVCYVRDRTILFIPCGHFVACATCASALSACPVCRKPFKGTIRAYLS